jgi:hypothetical protein
MTPPATVQTLPLLSMIWAADGMAVPLGEAVVAAAVVVVVAAVVVVVVVAVAVVAARVVAKAFMTDAALRVLWAEDGDSAGLVVPPHAASASTTAPSAAFKRLMTRTIPCQLLEAPVRARAHITNVCELAQRLNASRKRHQT